ncbi:cytochrome c oxidase subunit II [Rathayibacter toxicus]|uniref:cytochrome-c oxidase n=1 Tax=Rathayibacter toxicus TaxID=145458 RepID=A0A0C5BEN4_9MICO|nr:cytochrome c oxidase subunit II [Rathayibacter toxicus]AJM77489.1 cytochrome C oxidase subunit II [Rathayibacter toxicus]ALS56601.1 cytochrome C oxidase subunit II [Rathayibacter toxicus]KKM44693.1 cytochrome C oxidase subunit II [Rathayibacter toxicus]PPG21570.1 cytochrome c oxidase subunit II [Rathayibacter toxicus]PPG46534.1 cytochrome c oxidase subunit II [Rathayibacter toxicus]
MRFNRRIRRWVAAPVAGALSLVLAGCTQEQLQGWLPTTPGTTDHVDRVVGLWVTSWIVLLAVGVVTWGLTIWAVVVYRRRKGQTGLPVQLRYNMPIEIFYTTVPLILVIGFFAFTARDQAAIERPYDNPDQTIHVYGKQWAWDFNYVDENVYFSGIQGQYKDGHDEKGALVESEVPTLYLPVGEKIKIQLDSRDVIHSFWVIDFLYKKDMIPGKTNYMYVTPLKEGTYSGKCAELCGEYHSAMLFNVKVVSRTEYDSYIQSLRNAGHTGQLGPEYDRNTNQPGTGAPARTEN